MSYFGNTDREIARLADMDLLTMISFALIGILLALNIMLRFPDIGALVAQYNQF